MAAVVCYTLCVEKLRKEGFMEEQKKFDILSLMLVLSMIAALAMSSLALVRTNIMMHDLNPIITYAKAQNAVISKDYDKGQTYEKALKTNKPIIVIAYADWCGMSKKVIIQFNDFVKDKEISKDYAVAYINGDKDENVEFMKKYDIQGYPTMFVLKDGKVVKTLNNADFHVEEYNKKALIEKFKKEMAEL